MKKINISTLLLLTLVQGNLYALDCQGLAEGTEVRLDSPGKSLHNSRVQDQDGLGTCYANTASVLLQSVMPNNPNISYLSLAMHYSQDEDRSSKEGDFYIKSTPEDDSERNLIDGGFTCDAINGAKKRQDKTKQGGICQTEDVALEHSFFSADKNAYADPGFEQNNTLLNAAKFMSAYAEAFDADFTNSGKIKKRSEADKFTKNLDNYIKKNMGQSLRDLCTGPRLDDFAQTITNIVVKNFNNYPECILNNTVNPNISHCQIFNDLGQLKFDNSDKTLSFSLHDQITSSLRQSPEVIYKSNSTKIEFETNILNFIKGNIKSNQSESVKESFIDHLKNNIQGEDKTFLTLEYENMNGENITDCLRKNQLSYFSETHLFLEHAKRDKLLCQYENLLETIPALASAQTNNLIYDTKSLMDFILLKETELTYDNSIKKLIANDCTPDKRLALPNQIKCTDIATDLTATQLNNSTLFNQHILSHRKTFLENINDNRPLAIDFCTRYWSDPGYKLHSGSTQEKYNICMESGAHGFHATAMIGYRCKDNKIQYLSQNSWGPNWKLDDPRFEIESGKIWLDENELFENLINYSTVTK